MHEGSEKFSFFFLDFLDLCLQQILPKRVNYYQNILFLLGGLQLFCFVDFLRRSPSLKDT